MRWDTIYRTHAVTNDTNGLGGDSPPPPYLVDWLACEEEKEERRLWCHLINPCLIDECNLNGVWWTYQKHMDQEAGRHKTIINRVK